MLKFLNDERKLNFNNITRLDMKIEICNLCTEKKIYFVYEDKKKYIKNINVEKVIKKEDYLNVLLLRYDFRGFLFKEKKNNINIFINFYVNMESNYVIETGKGYSKQDEIKIKDIIYLSSEVGLDMKKKYFDCFYETGENESIFENKLK